MSSLVTLFPLYLKNLGVSETKMGSIITAVIIGTILSQIPLGMAADRYGKQKVLLVCASLVACIFIVMPLSSNWQSFLVTGAMLGAVAGSFYPIGLSLIGELVSGKRLGAATALFTLLFGIGSLVGPTVSGFAMTHLGNKWLFYLPATLTILFCFEVIFLYKKANGKKTTMPENQLPEA
jgi:MFS family permease